MYIGHLKVISFVAIAFAVSPLVYATSSLDLSAHPRSAVRLPGESFQSALRRYWAKSGGLDRAKFETGQTALQMALPVDHLKYDRLPHWASPEILSRGFKQTRDMRFLTTEDHPGFLRRSSWLYPDDGCFARAALASQNLGRWGYPRPAKIFIFGDLTVKTANSPSGVVNWWYHVVASVIVNQGVAILDPAIEPSRPLSLREWVLRMTSTVSEVKISICDPATYTPNDLCDAPDSQSERSAAADQSIYLSAEWERLIEMHRDPLRELGEFPPWLGFRMLNRRPY